MSARKFTNAFASPVRWTDENGAPILSISLDGYDISGGDATVEGCLFKLSLEDDQRSVVVSVDKSVDEYFSQSKISFHDWAEDALNSLLEDESESINIFEVSTGRSYSADSAGINPEPNPETSEKVESSVVATPVMRASSLF